MPSLLSMALKNKELGEGRLKSSLRQPSLPDAHGPSSHLSVNAGITAAIIIGSLAIGSLLVCGIAYVLVTRSQKGRSPRYNSQNSLCALHPFSSPSNSSAFPSLGENQVNRWESGRRSLQGAGVPFPHPSISGFFYVPLGIQLQRSQRQTRVLNLVSQEKVSLYPAFLCLPSSQSPRGPLDT